MLPGRIEWIFITVFGTLPTKPRRFSLYIILIWHQFLTAFKWNAGNPVAFYDFKLATNPFITIVILHFTVYQEKPITKKGS